MRANTQNEDPIQLGYEGIEDVDRITYLSCVVDQQGGSDALLKGNGGLYKAGECLKLEFPQTGYENEDF